MTDKGKCATACGWLLGNRSNPKLISLGLLLLRLMLGAIFIVHGLRKVTPLWGSKGFVGAKGAAAGAGMQPTVLWAVLLVIGELGGGILLVLGIGTRIGAAMIAFAMAVALLTVKADAGFLATHLQQMLLVASVTLLLTGGGALSVWPGRMGRRRLG